MAGGPAASWHGHGRQQRQALEQAQQAVAGGVDEGRREHDRAQARLAYRLLSERLGAEHARAMMGRGVERGEEQEALDPRALRGLHHAPGGDAVELLDRAARLVADRACQVHDRAHAAKRVAKRGRVGEVAERDLNAHALCAQAPGIPHQAAHRRSLCHQPAQQRGAHEAGRAGEQQHRANLARPRAGG